MKTSTASGELIAFKTIVEKFNPFVQIQPREMTRELRLKLALAKLLPDDIEITDLVNFRWKLGPYAGELLRDTEWLHVCWMFEKKMYQGEFEKYRHRLGEICYDKSIIEHTRIWQSAPWHHRAEAILNVNLIEWEH